MRSAYGTRVPQRRSVLTIGSLTGKGCHHPGLLRRISLPPGMVSFERRGFRLDRPDARAVLERHALAFLAGANLALNRHRDDLHDALAGVDEAERGFAYEGAGMIAAGLDLARTGAGGRHLAGLLEGPGEAHRYLVHVGAGWCGRFLPGALRPPARLRPLDGLERWLAIDGEGFARAFFAWQRPRPGPPRSPRHAILLQGAGRSLWFREAADPDGIEAAVAGAAPAARADLWSGIGLAAGFAGGATAPELARLREAAGGHWSFLAQGVAFAAEARRLAGHVPEHSAAACAVVLGVTPDVAAGWARTAAVGLPRPGAGPEVYLEWRRRVRVAAEASAGVAAGNAAVGSAAVGSAAVGSAAAGGGAVA